jgi:hypothetical protein
MEDGRFVAPFGSNQHSSIGFICDQPQKAGLVLVRLLQREPAVSDGAGVIHIRTRTQRGTLIPKARYGKNVPRAAESAFRRSGREALRKLTGARRNEGRRAPP